jgi:DNA-binding NarL/FixJ family response regulator
MSIKIGIATKAPFLSDMLRSMLPDDSGAETYTTELEVLECLPGEAQIIFMEDKFCGFATENFIKRLTRHRDLRIAVWTAELVMPDAAARYIAAGADSFFTLRNGEVRAIKDQVKKIVSGRRCYSAEIEKVLEGGNRFQSYLKHTTEREAEVIRYSLTGGSIQEIADQMGVEPVTVKTHKNHIFKKCGGKGYVVLLRYALSHGIISLDELGGRQHDCAE